MTTPVAFRRIYGNGMLSEAKVYDVVVGDETVGRVYRFVRRMWWIVIVHDNVKVGPFETRRQAVEHLTETYRG